MIIIILNQLRLGLIASKFFSSSLEKLPLKIRHIHRGSGHHAVDHLSYVTQCNALSLSPSFLSGFAPPLNRMAFLAFIPTYRNGNEC